MTIERYFVADAENPFQLDNPEKSEEFNSLEAAVLAARSRGGSSRIYVRWSDSTGQRDHGSYYLVASETSDYTLEQIALSFESEKVRKEF